MSPCYRVGHIRFTIYHHWEVYRVTEIPGGWFNIEDAVPGLDVSVEYSVGLQDSLHVRLGIIFEVPLYDPVGLVVYWPPRVLEDDIWTEDLMVAPRQT